MASAIRLYEQASRRRREGASARWVEKIPVVILEDGDMDLAVDPRTKARFGSSGQSAVRRRVVR